MFDQIERQALQQAVLEHSALRRGLEKFVRAEAAKHESNCASAMRTVPRQVERAADEAAKAEAFTAFLGRLEKALEREQE